MKKITILSAAFICALILLAGCSASSGAGKTPVNTPEKLELKEYTIDKIYCDERYRDDYLSPAMQRMNVYPGPNNMYYVYAGSAVSDAKTVWHTVYMNEEGMPSVLHEPFCYDPLCRHSDMDCLAYTTKGKTKLIALEDKVYIPANGEIGETNLVEYSRTDGKINVIGTYEIGLQLITRMGRFCYFTEQIETGQDDTGKLEYVLALYRYDLETGKTDYLGERPGDTHFIDPTPYGGEIYYKYAEQLYRCDYNLRNAVKVTGNHKIKTYDISGGYLWFLTETGDTSGSLYRKNLSGGESELLYENVTWFCIDGGTLYYSLYEPVEAFPWDIWMETKDGLGKKLVSRMITVDNGDKIYRIGLEKAGKKGSIAPFCETVTDNDFHLGTWFVIRNGLLIMQFRGPYSENGRNGLSSGIVVIDVETGESVRITSENFFLDGQIFPYDGTE